ncbi:hypothetical protein LTSEALA_2464 [Salmonella enterica subsp. enterica serovar Alachua str. R6-377]|uniref:Selenium delivery protein YdfZ n=1 Tax=Salmonella enterica subsp. enterica serovar Alachua str. R6-377 TaxID=913241 RepID=G5LP38_SALET|nr:hypothetical protein LTSEALA_2464 [Salmonella enterica subsp. enterica serovar Alachua str. R6-377]
MQVKFAAARGKTVIVEGFRRGKTVIVEGCEGKFAPVELIRLGMN